jgi:hypothetical protein
MGRLVLAAGALLALAACGGTSSSSSTSASSAPSSPTAAASVDTATAGVVCAAVNALVFNGYSGSDAIATAAMAYKITQAQVVYAIDHRCPQLKKIVPAGE